ncbi:MAG: hypothetical protein V1792_12110, partial [Pseudomonadota bacterium]
PDYDVWTPRNVPMGIAHPVESEVSGSGVQLTGPETGLRDGREENPVYSETAGESPAAEATDEPGTGESPAVSDEADLPETIELTWFEPMDSLLTAAEEKRTDSSQALPAAETRRYAIPENLEVSWSEPANGKTGDRRDGPRKIHPARYHGA